MLKKSIKLLKDPLGFLRDFNFHHSFSTNIISLKRRKLYKYFSKKTIDIYKRKTPSSDKYPFTIHDTYSLFEEDSGYERLFPVGENWLEKEAKKPIALMVGFNDWKFGFTADYLPEYRTVFTSRKLSLISTIKTFHSFKNKPSVIIVWGYTENFYVKNYAKKNNIPLYRMEDGFVRSSELGASHSTPYSLILDKRGLYYNPESESDIEHILNNYDFKNDIQLRQESKESLDLLIELKISKYNQATTSSIKPLGIKLKKRVVILGQVDNDAAIRFANHDKWTSEELVKLARYENPEADVYYRPHPEVYKGYQKSQFRKKKIEYFAKVLSPEEPLIEFLETMDHVYVINSLSGFEALIRGKKVTVVGAAFYAGWGLTDDRLKLERRERKLSLDELFAGVYLKYPRYLADKNNSKNGLTTTCYKIKSDIEIVTYNTYKSLNIELSNILSSPYWAQLFFNENINESILEKIDFTIYLRNGSSQFFQKIYLLSLFGLINNDHEKSKLLSRIRAFIDHSVYNDFLSIISNIYERNFLIQEISWLLNQDLTITVNKELIAIFNCKKDNYKKNLFDTTKKKNIKKTTLTQREITDLQNELNSELNSANYKNILKILKILGSIEVDIVAAIKENIETNIFNFYEYHMKEKEFEQALKLAEIMLLFGLHTRTLISKLVNYSKLNFDFISVIQLSKLNQNIDLYAQNRNMALTEITSYGSQDIEEIGKNKFNTYLMKFVSLKPNSIASVSFILDKYKDEKMKKEMMKVLEASLYLDNEQSIRKAQSFIAIDQASKAIPILENIIKTEDTTPGLICSYTQALSFSYRLKEAIKHIELALKQYVNIEIYHEAIRLYILANDYTKCLNILKIANNNNLEIGEMYLRKTYFGNRMIGKALETFSEIPPKKNIYSYYKQKYFDISANFTEFESITVLSIFGPGDEIRFASIYNSLQALLNINNITITCSPKLHSLFHRSFKNLKFISSEKLRDSDFDYSKKFVQANYSKVLGFDLLRTIDNHGSNAIEKSDKVVMVTDLLHKILPDYESFSGMAYLQNNRIRTEQFKKNLPLNNILVGISWRSSLTTHSRNEHYLTIEELAPLFELDGVSFINFQYDECSDELNWVEEKYPGKIINFQELDQYDDLDGVASLMKCMDLIISPATTVVELAGALGCKTWMFSNSSEIDWRKIDNIGTDVWHNSITIIEGDIIGDKVSLMKNLTDKLKAYINQSKEKNV